MIGTVGTVAAEFITLIQPQSLYGTHSEDYEPQRWIRVIKRKSYASAMITRIAKMTTRL